MLFGLKGLKTICYIYPCLIIGCGIFLLVNAINFRKLWFDADHIMGKIFTISADVAFYMAWIIIIIGCIGLIAVYNCQDRLMKSFIMLLTVLIPALVVCGFHLYVDSYSEHSANFIRINAFIRGMSPMRLNSLQRVFHCCGVERYTDYYLIWTHWGANLTEITRSTEKSSTTKSAMLTSKSTVIRITGDEQPPPPSHSAFLSSIPTTETWEVTETETDAGTEKKTRPTTSGWGHISDVTINISIYTDVASYGLDPDSEKLRLSADVLDLEPPSLEELDALLGYYQDPAQKYKYKTTKNARFNNRISRINTWINSQLAALREKLKKWVKIDVHYMRQYAPNLMVRAVQSFLKTTYNVYKYIQNPSASGLKWAKSSGWEEMAGVNDLIFGLPHSCCKNPQDRCTGNQQNTWKEGCRDKVASFYQQGVYHFAIIMLCTIPIVFLTIITFYLYKAGLAEHYLF